jgi:hypothetical protein
MIRTRCGPFPPQKQALVEKSEEREVEKAILYNAAIVKGRIAESEVKLWQ